MWYGLTKENIIRGFLIFVGLGIIAAVAGFIGAEFSDPGPNNPWALLFLVLIIPGIWVALSLILTITWLRVDDKKVEWFLWKKVRLLSCPIEDITHIGRGLVSAFILKTRTGLATARRRCRMVATKNHTNVPTWCILQHLRFGCTWGYKWLPYENLLKFVYVGQQKLVENQGRAVG